MEEEKSTIVVGGFKTLLSVTDRSRMQKINNDIHDLNSTINQIDLLDI